MFESKKRYGKPSDALIRQKVDFFENNNKYLEREQEFALLYKKHGFGISAIEIPYFESQ